MTEEQISDMIENADGMRCIDGEYRIDGRDLMNLVAAILQAATRDALDDTARLDFMLANDAFTVPCNRDGSIKQYQLMTQDEDENYHVLHNEQRFYNTEREAIDAAIESSAPPQKPVSDEVKP